MPDIVINNILNRLPLQDAVRTAILERRWRYNWTMLSQLVFDDDFCRYLLQKGGEKNYGKIIGRLLLRIKGAITKFVLYMEEGYGLLDDEDINHWLLFLSSKGVTDITLWKENYGPPLKLPTHLFSCLELKHLKLVCCCFGPPASFHGFPNLISLELSLLKLYKIKNFGEFLTGCPALEILNLGFNFLPGKVKVDELVKLVNLKTLSLHLFNFRYTTNTSCSSIFELVGSLPKLQELDLDFSKCKSFTKDGGGKRSSTVFSCLKALKLTGIDLGNGIMRSCAF
ncbi:F-box/FBD/LRR-repeat protein At1g13570-like [Bidens hawaiensis]|uniref:F-box/FBD/LRR-repeat protein At1g13570-like n=1 Tax=Bidens hawaiensis TaxID=980011 RepID=UPI004049583E